MTNNQNKRRPAYFKSGDDSKYRPKPKGEDDDDDEDKEDDLEDLDMDKLEDRALLRERSTMGDPMATCLEQCVCLAPKWKDPERVHPNLKIWNIETIPILPDPHPAEGTGDEQPKVDGVSWRSAPLPPPWL